jgi:Domain of unknown function (DUF3399)
LKAVRKLCICSQKARLARIAKAKEGASVAFAHKKKAAEARLAAKESGIELDENCNDEDIFELQHHHLLKCLEKTTVSFESEIHCRIHREIFHAKWNIDFTRGREFQN